MKIKNLLLQAFFLCAIFIGMMNTGCSTLDEEVKEVANDIIKFSENQNVLNTSNRQYKKTTRQKIEEDSELQAQAGSMWVMEGQGAYLFAQNKTRKEGDLLNVKLDGGALKQVDTKVSVIRKLLKQLEDQEAQDKLKQQQEDGEVPLQKLADGSADGSKDGRSPAADKKSGTEKAGTDAASSQKSADKADEKAETDGPTISEGIPTRITERMADGNYRLKGQAPFMIGKREYRVIVTGMIRAEDYNDEGVSSNKLLDAQYDVVSLRKKEAL